MLLVYENTQLKHHVFLWSYILQKNFWHIPGVVPLSFHVDGAEFFRDTEYNVWSMSSILSSSDFPGKMWVYVVWQCDYGLPQYQTLLALRIGFSFAHAAVPKVWDIKFPCVIIPHESMKKPQVSWLNFVSVPQPNLLWHRAGQVKALVHELVGRLLAWSMTFASAGTFPLTGFLGEDLDPKSFRLSRRGQTLTGGWRQGWWFIGQLCCFKFWDNKAKMLS